jgi:serine/threonine protein kinase
MEPLLKVVSPDLKDLIMKMLRLDATERITIDEILCHPFLS